MAFLSSWGHWEQQGRPREPLMPEVGLEAALGPSRCAPPATAASGRWGTPGAGTALGNQLMQLLKTNWGNFLTSDLVMKRALSWVVHSYSISRKMDEI